MVAPGGVDDIDPSVPLVDPGLVDPEPIEPIAPLFVVLPERREWLRVADEVPPVPVAEPLPIAPLPIAPLLVAPLPVEPGAVLPAPGVVLVIVPGVAPVPADPLGLLPAICAPAAVATSAVVITINAFMATLLDWVVRGYWGGGYWGVGDGGVAAFGASVPTRPSPVVPADAAPIGGVTPVAGCGRAGATGDPGDIAEPRPDGVVPGAGIAPAGEYGVTGAAPTVPPAGIWAITGVAASAITIVKVLIILASIRLSAQRAGVEWVALAVALPARLTLC